MHRHLQRTHKALKKYLIPNEENDHKPKLLQPRTIAFVCLVAFVIESVFLLGSAIAPRSRLFGTIFVNALIDGTNQARAGDALPALHENPLLDAAAQMKANDMAANGYFAHTSPSGLTPWYWFDKAGYGFFQAGENLAVDFSDSQDVTNAWLNSPEHRANILNTGFTEIGMATAEGTFQGHSAIFVVEEFGMPSVALAEHPPAAPTPTPKPAPKPAPAPTSLALATETPNFVAVKGAATALASASGASTTSAAPDAAAAPADAPAPIQSNFVQTVAAAPRHTLDYFYYAIVILFGAALLVNIFVKIRIQHPQVILGGMLVILLAGLFIVLNQHFGTAGATVL